ncbi:polymorphic toxin-type HINT domain-containing protein (plasmid) [Embleya sp. NBC_00888]|uniref:polymorphic toxin-type HINT domain-containing protein n=1 Tax=Embleya sp. NBC_00888 TaxID=2975960 RepID=UPI002F914C3C|nr:polymorphic toxin-type HINT domain-containing protein [Embleya sp. NBC_00888]WSY48114.1 polymorphic toxin-type HINT domain-containing protein [Embleya sp. NBC_00888]
MTGATVLALTASVGPAQAVDWIESRPDNEGWSPRDLPKTPSVGGKKAPKPDARPIPGDGHRSWKPTATTWPKPAESETTPAPASNFVARGGSSLLAAPTGGNAPGTPVWITTPDTSARGPLRSNTFAAPATGAASPSGRLKVTVADHAAAERAGVDGVLITVRPTDTATAPGKVTVGVDYAGFRDAFGADWSSRLRLVSMPECALTTPDVPACRVKTPVTGGRNDRVKNRVLADVDLTAASPTTAKSANAPATGGAMVFAATADASGPSGDYKATSLSPSGQWSAGGNSGSMNWSYAIGVPPAIGGTAPTVSLAYNSGAVDGRTTSTNNQASWIGEGWEYSPGFVERSYQSCARDGQDKSGEKCWSNQNSLTLSLNGKSSTLIQDDTDKTKWRLEGDDDSRIEPLTGAVNGDDNGEYWRLTTGDGVQYYFGVGHKPGGNNQDTATNSTWSAPVYGNNAGEPCNKTAGFDASWCRQGWRWNLDYVVDPRGGMVTYWYNAETNRYTRGTVLVGSGTLTEYTRGGTLAKITYGSKTTDTTPPTAQVLFDTAERCLVKDGFDCDPAKMTKANAAKWPDVPVDKQCATSGTCEEHGQSFFSTRRLTKIVTQSLVGAGYQTVDEYALGQDYPDPQDGSSPTLWLNSITRTAWDGAKKIDVPSVDFTGEFMHNRVDAGGDLAPPMNRRRLKGITNETGGQTTVVYNTPECTPATLPTPDANTKACYPMWWNYDEDAEPVLHWFHKYTVAEVTEHDIATTAPNRSTRYEYVGGAAWHRDDSELTEDKEASRPKSKDRRTWNQYRGYGQVITRSGVAPDPVTQSATFYLRGMDADVRKDGTTRAVTLTDSTGASIVDANHHAGFAYETKTFTGDGGTVAATSLSTPHASAVTATHARVRGLPPLTARRTATEKTRDRSLLADGTTWRETSKSTTFEPVHGLPETVSDKADGLPEYCTKTTYAHNTSAWIIGKPAETRSLVGTCATTPSKDTVYAWSHTLYDNKPYGDVGAVGDTTSTDAVIDYKADGTPNWVTTTKSEYDAYGRVTKATDAENKTTTTAYTPAAGSLPTTVAVTGPANWTASTVYAGARNLPVKAVDANGLVIEQEYDTLGRLIAVWKPGHTKQDNADLQFAYAPSKTGPSVVTTRTLKLNKDYAVSHRILNSFLQERQTQSDPVNDAAGRMITDTFHDSLGRPHKTNTPYLNEDDLPNTDLFVANDNEVPGQNAVVYDGMGRTTAQTFSSKAIEQWRTTTAYVGADETRVTPPPGGTATLSISDARGKPKELREYNGGAPTGTDYSKITYTYTPREELKTVTDPGGNTWTYTYDFLGRKTHVDDPDKGPSDTRYDLVGRVTGTTDARGQILAYTYDALGRKTATYKDTVADANLLSEWTYDRYAKGQADGSSRYVGGKSGAKYTSEITGFEPGTYRPTGTRVTIPSAEGKLAGTYTTATTYEPVLGLPIKTDVPAQGGLPAETLSSTYSTQGLRTKLGGERAYLNRAIYDVFGRNIRATLGDAPLQAAFTSAYDPATGRLLSTNWDKQTATTASVDATSYTYKPSGDVTSVKTVRDGTTTDTQCFAYDGLRRLKQAWTDTAGTTTLPAPSVPGIGGCVTQAPSTATVGGPDPYWQSFDYDAVGNRTKLVEHDATDDPAKNVTTEYGYRPGAQAGDRTHRLETVTLKTGTREAVTTGLTYDANGSIKTRPGADANLQTLTWNEEDKLAKVASATGSSDYLYDADGQRIIRREAGKTTLYLGSDELTTNTDQSGPVVGTRYYPTAGGAAVVRSGNGAIVYMAADHHGTPVSTLDSATLDATRRQSKPFGEPRGPQPTQANGQWPDDKGFLGKPMDATGLTHVGAREYDPDLGRFISVDPIMDLTDAGQMHGYTYSNNNPLTQSDPSGMAYCGNVMSCDPDPVYCGNVMACGGSGTDQTTTSPTAPGGTAGCVRYCMDKPKKPSSSNTGKGKGNDNPFAKAWGAAKKKTSQAAHYVQDNWKKVAPIVAGGLAEWGCMAAAASAGAATAGAAAVGGAMLCGALGNSIYGALDDQLNHGDRSSMESLVKIAGDAGIGALTGGAAQGVINKYARVCHSFVPGTGVLMANGTTKAIEDVQPGDAVLATDPETGESKPRTVLAAITTEDDKEFADLTIKTEDGEASIIATTNHPFWVPDLKEWVDAGDLKPGQHLRSPDGTWIWVEAVRRFGQPARTHDLTVDYVHTYYVSVGTTSILVHNDNGNGAAGRLPDLSNTTLDEADRILTQHGFDLHSWSERGYVTYRAKDGSKITLRDADGRVSRSVVVDNGPNTKNGSRRVGPDGKNTLSHDTGEMIKPFC